MTALTNESNRTDPGRRGRTTRFRSGRVLVQVAAIIALGFAAGMLDAFYFRPIDLKAREVPAELDLTKLPERPKPPAPSNPNIRTPQPDSPASDPVAPPDKPAVPTPAPASTPPASGATPQPGFEFTPKSALKPGHITVEEARALFDAGSPFIDARKLEAYVEGHVEMAFRLDMNSFREGNPPQLALIPREAMVVVYCNGGQCDESEHVAEFLNGSGYKKVYIMHDGFPGWKAAGHPVQTGEPQF